VALAAAASCSSTSSSSSSSSSPKVPDSLPAAPATNQNSAFSGNGPYAAGVTYETTPQGDPVVVYYPVSPSATKGRTTYSINLARWLLGSPTATIPAAFQGLPTTLATTAYAGLTAAAGTFPVVLFSHGYGGYPEQSSFLTDHLATWGFVVVAPDHRSRDLAAELAGKTQDCFPTCDVTDLENALALARTLDGTKGGFLDGRLDLTRVASLGHSAGGGAAIAVAAADADVRTYIGLAPASGPVPTSAKPGMIVQGGADTVVKPTESETLYGTLPTPKRLILIEETGHNVFDDACVIGAAQGGLTAFIGKLGLQADFVKIATDGCSAPDISPPVAWPLIDQAVTAQLRFGLGIDPQPVGLGPTLGTNFPGVTALVTATPPTS
jgi:dienelactone hydrolase